MPQSLAKIQIHIIFSTKNRMKFIDETLEGQLYAYMRGICESMDTPLIAVGGMQDHIHLLVRLSKKYSLSDIIRHIKGSSSKWTKTKGAQYSTFSWQRGYAAFSVSESQLAIVKSYIANQKQHHQKNSFKSELIALLKKHNIEYDEAYLWD